MVTGYRNTRGKLKVGGTEEDPIYTVVQGISIITFFNEDSLTTVAASPTEATIVTQAYSAAVFENIVLAEVSGTNYAKYRLKVNGAIIATKRTGPALNTSFDFTGAPYALIIGDSVTITVEHFNGPGTIDCEATLFGYA